MSSSPLPPADHVPGAVLEYRGPGGLTKPGGLIAWGVILCVLGAGAGCIGLLTPLTMLVPAPQRLPAATLVATVGFYLLIAVAAFVLAVACFRARRWVSKVMLAIAWPMLVGSAITVPIAAATAALMDMPGGANMPPGVRIATVVGILMFGLLMGVGLPLAVVCYFGSQETRRRLAELDANPNWTDGKPTPVLALSLWMALGALLILIGAANAVAPFFGIVFTGPAAVALIVAQAAALMVGAWLVFQKRPAGWWVAVGMTIIFFGSSIITVLVQGGEAVTLAAMTSEQRDMMVGNPMMGTAVQASIALLYLALLVGVLLWIRPFFDRQGDGGHLPQAGYV